MLEPIGSGGMAVVYRALTVDGDRSTNDTILIFANGEAGAPEITGPGEALDAFQAALDILTDGLARAVARDGEGATKLIEITVAGAQTELSGRTLIAPRGESGKEVLRY